MSDRKISGKSVAAFLFMPQFRHSMPAFSHIGIVFVRTLALMFIQSGLLEPNHPAKFYGMNNQRKIKARDLIGEAWYNLRTGEEKNLYQYSIFVAVVLMILTVFSSVLIFLATLVSSSEAFAQIFSLTTGNDTGFAGVAGNVGAGGALYRLSNNPDLAISLLDAVLRFGAFGNGGAIQNGLAIMMGTYSTAVMVIAAFIAFWAIVSVVTDTARTGQFGGGRHNMVWAPIRFVFALGILVPIGGGFNGGQLIVLKLAEWGSNLGTNIWVNYVASVQSNEFLSSNEEPSIMPTIQSFLKVKICQKMWNAGTMQATGDPNNPNMVTLGIKSMVGTDGNIGTAENLIFSYSNDSASDLCGSLSRPNDVSASMAAAQAAGDPTYQATRTMKTAYLNAYGAPFEAIANRFACGFVNEFYSNASAASTPWGALQGCTLAEATGGTNCGAGGEKDGVFPNASCIQEMYDYASGQITPQIAVARGQLEAYLSGTPFLTEVSDAGWAGMGVWYHTISRLNTSFKGIVDSGVSVVEPSILGQNIAQRALTRVSALFGGDGATLTLHTKDALSEYDEWWPINISDPASGLTAAALGNVNRSFSTAVGTVTQSKDQKGFIQEKVDELFGDGFILDMFLVENAAANTYPMASLATIGQGIIDKALIFYGGLGLMSVAIGAGTGPGWAMLGPVGNMFSTFAGAGLAAGIVLLYYVPLIPWIRVTMAVVAWLITVFEAIVTIPVVALAHLRTDGEGLMGSMAQGAYILWLNLLLRPALTVMGYVAALIMFNAMIPYINETFLAVYHSITGTSGSNWIGQTIYAVIYVGIIYSMANSLFKMIDLFPNSTMKWLGGPQDQASDGDNSEALLGYAAGSMSGIGSATSGIRQGDFRRGPNTGGDGVT